MKYKIGQKVVYIGPDFRGDPAMLEHKVTPPIPRAIYTIRGGMPAHPCNQGPAYLFEEIVNPVRRCDVTGWIGEIHIPEESIRPLIARKNDGEAFVAGLRPLLKQVWRIKVPGDV